MDQENRHTGSKNTSSMQGKAFYYQWKILSVFIFLNLLPEFPDKSFIIMAILRITQYATTRIND